MKESSIIENKQTKEQTEEQTTEYNESSQNTAESSMLIQAKGKQEKSSNEVKSKGKKDENEKFDRSTLSLSNNL